MLRVVGFLCFLGVVHSLFEGLFGGSSVGHAGIDNAIRLKGRPIDPPATKVMNATYGVDPSSISLYTGSTFTCMSDETVVINSNLINDGWCDCEDGSDEPGSSACSNVGGRVFVCSNDGHRPKSIPSGRVDDGICDCCDGSDEGMFTKCDNYCIVDREAEELAKSGLIEDFRVGSSKRKGLVNEATKLYNEKRGKQRDMDEELSRLHNEKESLQRLFDDAQKERDELVSHLRAAAEEKISRLLRLTGGEEDMLLSDDQVDILVKALFVTLNERGTIKKDVIGDFMRDKGLDALQSDSEESQYPDMDGEDEYSDYEADMMEEEVSVEGGVDANENIGGEDIPHYDANEEDAPSADEEVPREHLREFLSWAVQQDGLDCHNQASILVGYYLYSPDSNSASVEMASDFAKRAAGKPEECSTFFAQTPELIGAQFCEEVPQALTDELTSFRDMPEIRGRDEITQVEERIRSKEAEAQEARGFQERFLKFQAGLTDGGAVGFLSPGAGLVDNCVTMKDHTYEYSVCFGDPSEARQGNTRLGKLDRFELQSETGVMKLYFNEGDHCWNHGPRVSEVSISCGAANSISSVSEPSTCVYFIEMTSPNACSAAWKEANYL
jgi:protein kinase C substrate 80K-H